jgi:hypothetical protein
VVAEAITGQGAGQRGGRGAALLAVPGAIIGWLRETSRTTPGRMGLTMAGLVVLSVLMGVIGLSTLSGRQQTLYDLVSKREPVNAAAQEIYRSLSDADSTASSAFLYGAVEPNSLRQRYQSDIQQTGFALEVAATDITTTDQTSGQPIAILSANLPVYTGLIERATANNVQGFPVGSAYLREADNLMRGTLLPAADRLYQIDLQKMSGEQDDVTGFPYLLLAAIVLLVVALVLASRYFSRRTNRTFNLGLVVAALAVVVAVLWSATALTAATIYVTKGRSTGSELVTVLSQVRSQALKARTDELLTLADRGGKDYTSEFTTLTNSIGGTDGSGGLLNVAQVAAQDNTMASIRAAMAAARNWFALHARMVGVYDAGDYRTAVGITLGLDPAYKEADAYNQLDTALAQGILEGRTIFLDQTATAENWMAALPIGVLALALVAAGGCVLGSWQRLREYR